MLQSVTTLQQILFDLSGILPADAQPLFSVTRPAQLAANAVYIPEGDRSKKLAFIEKGIIRAYRVKDNGDEATLFLRWEGQFAASHDTIIHSRPSRFIYRALEDTSLLEIDYDVLETVLKAHTEYEPLRNFFLMKMLAESLDLIETFVTLSPEERYRRLVKDKFDIVNRVPDKYIASMLGITPVSLSRIRKRIHARGQH
ncbi:Crp/Fnr family transcriptional regulator [Chitinophaga agrisoli]|uniref:Crp/Fnr family transcriptional regulator n=1 Tax=Chitinophaga agrisoli TaxID=2607653 RepID=A0A5B2VT55_9BACT|nr:Crp/Fnr family transcriptional regulator [Chitinophaga agrisoli]KAA2242983.1 Crp/Fnr family transcriptional regulator [Chitinophaga agrisoli]